MAATQPTNNPTAKTALCAAFVAVESYFLYSILGLLAPHFWLSNVVMHILSAFAAYLIMNAIMRRTNTGKRKKAIVGVVILAATIIAAVTLSVVVLYLTKLRLQ